MKLDPIEVRIANDCLPRLLGSKSGPLGRDLRRNRVIGCAGINKHGFAATAIALAAAITWATSAGFAAGPGAEAGGQAALLHELESLRLAVADLTTTFGAKYPAGPAYLRRVDALRAAAEAIKPGSGAEQGARWSDLCRQCGALRQEALLANPLLDFPALLLVKRNAPFLERYEHPEKSFGPHEEVGMPCNHLSNASLSRTTITHTKYPRRDEIALLRPLAPAGKLSTLYRPAQPAYVGQIDLNCDGQRLLFARADKENWKIFEIRADGSGLRQVSRTPPDVDQFDPCYLPSGRIVFASDASYQSVPCWSGIPQRVANLYEMEADGGGLRQLCFDQDHDHYPRVRSDGQIMYTRWEYTGTRHEYLRVLMAMNPDGTNQHALYGSNSWWPNAIYFARQLPDDPNRLIAVVSDYHGLPRMGWLMLFDTAKGWYDADGVVQQIPGRGRKVVPEIKEKLVAGTWPIFLSPFPLSDKYFLTACRPSADRGWGIYLVDVFDNLVLLREEPGYALLEPVPLRASPRPPVIADRVDLARHDAQVFLQDVYYGKGLEGVPRGTIKRLRIVAYDFGYPGLAGPVRIGINGPWEVMRILGTVPVQPDGSALFRVPANTPISVQPLDAAGKAVQLMRSWYTAMPGETVSCMGCHERRGDAPPSLHAFSPLRTVDEIAPWHGPARGFDFEREVQPVLDRYCVSCHDGKSAAAGGGKLADLRGLRLRGDYHGYPLGKCDLRNMMNSSEEVRRVESLVDRSLPPLKNVPPGNLMFTPAYEALLPLVRRIRVEDDIDMPLPGEFHADTSRLVQMLQRGHYGVQLDAEAWDRLVTWIDLNAPCHGTWGEVYPIPHGAHERRLELRGLYGGPPGDPEQIFPVSYEQPTSPLLPAEKGLAVRAPNLPSPVSGEGPGVRARTPAYPFKKLTLSDGVQLTLVWIPPGEAVLGDTEGQADEQPLTHVTLAKGFWMSSTEITNRQYHCFDPQHESGYARDFCVVSTARKSRPLNEPEQPAVRVSWLAALDYCRWLSARCGLRVTLPTETQWEYAARAGSREAFYFGGRDADFSRFANLAGRELGPLGDHLWSDRQIVTAPVASFQPNAWGLYDMHGNAAEWTLSTYRLRPYQESPADGQPDPAGRKAVRGGSFYDRPEESRASARCSYPAWQRLHNVGFRIVAEEYSPLAGLQTGAAR